VEASTGVADRFGLVQQATTNVWGAYLNSALQSPTYNLGFSTGLALAGGEYHGTFTRVDGCWGCADQLKWDWSANRGTSYTVIPMPTGQFNDGGIWSIQPSPSPFRIHN
jgi:hypothetical protein